MRKIPKKNYFILGILTIVIIIIVICVNQWIKAYKFIKMNESPLITNISQVNEKELHLSLAESNQIILYVGYNHNTEIRKFEKELLKKIKSKNLNEYIIYYDITEKLQNNEYLSVLKKEFPEIESKIKKAPMFVYVKNGTAIEVVDSEKEMITIEAFNNLINKYELGK